MSKPFTGFRWLALSLCLALVLGFSGCTSHRINSVSRITFLVKENSFSRTNIGLIGASASIFEPLTLPTHPNSEAGQGILIQAFQGMWYGAVAGFEVGQEFCGLWGGHAERGHMSVNGGDATVALALLVLCGGGIVGGVSIGVAYGMVAPFVSSPHPSEILIAQERVIQGIWEQLISQEEREGNGKNPIENSRVMDDATLSMVRFGVKDQPYSAFMRIEPIQVGLFTKSKFNPKALTLLWNIRVIFFDSRQRMVAKQIIEIEQGEYQFDEWAWQEASLLKAKLGEGYQLAADQIRGKLSRN